MLALTHQGAAAGAFALHKYNQIHVDRSLILKAFAILALGNAIINLLKRSATHDHVSHSCAYCSAACGAAAWLHEQNP